MFNFTSQVTNNVLVGADVKGNQLFVDFDPHLDVLRSIRILECVDRFFNLVTRRANSSNHDCLAVTSERVFEHTRQFRVTEWHKGSLLVFVAESIDTVSQGEQGSVNLGALHQAQAPVLGHCATLRACQIDQRQLTAQHLLLGVFRLVLDSQLNLADGVGT